MRIYLTVRIFKRSSRQTEAFMFAMFLKAMSVLALAAVVVAAPGPRSLPSGTVTCGRDNYSVSSITAAINAGVSDMNSGNLPGACVVLDARDG